MLLRFVSIGFFLIAFCSVGGSWPNVLKDPGFERYHYDANLGYYAPDDDAAWREIGMGTASVRFDASNWSAPSDMIVERPLGFSPGAMGYEGTGPTQNKGRLIFQQDIVNPALFQGSRTYEAWVWLGGAGLDDETLEDRKDETGGWEILFYASPNPAEWTGSNALEYHHATLDFPGPPNSFVRVSGYGRFPSGTVGMRVRVWAATWSAAAGGGNYNTRVAVDNAHFAIIDTPNLLTNGNFEQDIDMGPFHGWQRPAAYAFPLNGFNPIDLNNVYGEHFDHGGFRPYYGATRNYGYETWLNGWMEDAFNFSQTVPFEEEPGTPMVLMCYWAQDTRESLKRYQMRIEGGELQFVVRYLQNGSALKTSDLRVRWPCGANVANTCQYDHNGGIAYNPRFRLIPPEGTTEIELNVNFQIHMPYGDGLSHVSTGVDDFFLAPWGSDAAPTQASLVVR